MVEQCPHRERSGGTGGHGKPASDVKVGILMSRQSQRQQFAFCICYTKNST